MLQVGANKDTLVTKTSSMGMWLPVHGDEWDGDVPLGLERVPSDSRKSEKGTVTFKGNTLPWLVGRYEVRIPSILLQSFIHGTLDSLSPRRQIQRHEPRWSP